MSLSSQTRRVSDDSLGISTEGYSVPYFPDRTVWYLFYYTNRDLKGMRSWVVGKNTTQQIVFVYRQN